MNEIAVSCTELQHQPDCEQIKNYCEKVLSLEEISNWELSILLCGNKFIQELNKKFRDRDEPTDVLSFSQNQESRSDGMHTAGDIVLSLDFIENNSELKRCIVHGILHLEGMEHGEDADRQEMLSRQEKIMDTLQNELFEVL